MKARAESVTKRPALFRSCDRGYGFFALMPVLLCLALIWPFGGGGKKIHMMAGSETPAAHATINVKQGDNGNTRLDIKADALAKPSALTPPENVYVVWVQPPGQTPKNMGQLSVDNDLKGELKTETPYHRFAIFITAEKQPQVQAPQGEKVLSADVAQG